MTRFLLALACAGIMLAQRSPVDDAWDLAAKGSRDQAIRILEHFIKSNPRDADALLLLGSLLMEKGERAESIASLTQGVHLRPDSADAQNALGEAYSNFGDLRAARAPFEKAVALKPGFAIAQVNLGLVLVEAGEFAAAAPHLDRAIRILGRTPDAAYPHYLRAKIYAAENNGQKAIAELNRAVSLRPDFAEAWSDLGVARKNILDDAGALAAEKRAVELNPADAIAQYRLGAEYLRQDQPQLAVDPLEKAYRLNPEDQSTLNALHTALRLNGKTDEANRVKQKLTELLRKRDQMSANALKAVKLNNEGAALEKAGDLRNALEKYGQALDLYPSHVPIRVNYAVALLRLGQWTEGLNQLHEALERDPGNAKIQAAFDDALKQAPRGSVPQWDGRDTARADH
jgi:tetratricopeptide (TPR) repeat protein